MLRSGNNSVIVVTMFLFLFENYRTMARAVGTSGKPVSLLLTLLLYYLFVFLVSVINIVIYIIL